VVRVLFNTPEMNPTVRENAAIRFASQNGHTEIVRLLLRRSDIDPSALNNYALCWAKRNRYIEICKMLKARIPWYKRMFV